MKQEEESEIRKTTKEEVESGRKYGLESIPNLTKFHNN